MAPRKKKETETGKKPNINAYIAGAGLTVEQPITETLESNFMPYAMSIIVSRAIPEIDGFKPSHRKLLYTLYNAVFYATVLNPRIENCFIQCIIWVF